MAKYAQVESTEDKLMELVLFRFFRSEERKKMLKTEKAFAVALIAAILWTVWAIILNYFVTGHILAKDFEPSSVDVSIIDLVALTSTASIAMIILAASILSFANMVNERHRVETDTTNPQRRQPDG